jgi:hypothetical protein
MDNEHDALVRGLARLMRSQAIAVDPEHDAAERERLVQTVARTPSGRPARPRQLVPARALWPALAAALVAAGVALALWWPDAALDFEVQGAPLAEQGYVRASDKDATIAFSEGSTVRLERGSVGRVVEVTPRGARVLLENGRATVHVVHQTDSEWSLAAGPFVVLVTGTSFDLSWQPDGEKLVVELREGTVTVRGPLVQDGLMMRSGQRLVARVPERDLKLVAIETAPEASITPAKSSPSPTPSADDTSSAEPDKSAGPAVETIPWSKRIANGDFKGVLAEARARGIESVLASGSLDELWALADAARYEGEGGLSRRAMIAVRERFPTSDAAHTAAFLLGRMAEGGSPSGAITWYDTYLGEAPRGTYAAEALGRKLELVRRTRGTSAARPLAQQYLASYPKGPYAKLARDILR